MKTILKNYYQILGVPRDAGLEEIETKYLQACEELEHLRKTEPWFPFREAILEITKAHYVLSDPELRSRYDQTLDFDIVVLDKNIEKTELAGVAREYKRYWSSRFDEFNRKFENFKKETGISLWLIKTTTLFLVFAMITSTGVTYYLLFHANLPSTGILNSLKSFGFGLFFLLVVTQYLLFRKFWQKKKQKNLNLEEDDAHL